MEIQEIEIDRSSEQRKNQNTHTHTQNNSRRMSNYKVTGGEREGGGREWERNGKREIQL